MASGRKRDKINFWLSSLCCLLSNQNDGSGGFFKNANHPTLHNPTMTYVRGSQHTTYVQADHTTVTQIMTLLSQHIIQGAAHDDSARSPPPRCHPETRVKLIVRVTAWFNGQAQQELLLWITGPAGVGKSAIVQTFAEYLAKSKSLGASVFISRPNKRNNPHGIFITIAYQLATRIEEYRKFIAERLSLDPSLLNKDMEAQFSTFILEPFVEKGIGAGGKRWGILLDGLDELRGDDAQCNIIQLISTFVREHRDAPLVWIIASRPESHISHTFDDDEVRLSYWTEDIPIDSTEACEDVERFLRSSFQMTQKKFRHSAPSDWPSNTDFLKLTAAASGLFVYAEVVMQFIRDPAHADPVSRLKVLLSVIDRSTAVPTKENPFVHLDALYHEILSSIPSALWPATKQLLGFTIDAQRIHDITPQNFQTLRGMSILFNLARHTIYACLNKGLSVLKIPDWKAAHKEKLMILHASFVDYLIDRRRSGDFHVGDFKDVEAGVMSNIFEVWNKCSGDGITPALVESTWQEYCSKLDNKTPSRTAVKFHATLFRDVVYSLRQVANDILVRSTYRARYLQLRKVHITNLCYYFEPRELLDFVENMANSEIDDIEFYRQIQFKDITFGHLAWKELCPAKVHLGRRSVLSKEDWILDRPRSSSELKAFVSELESLQGDIPELKVAVFGGVPKGRVVGFRAKIENRDIYYVIPYPE